MDWSEQNDKIWGADEQNFPSLARRIFHFQYENNPVYRSFSEVLGFHDAGSAAIEEIPFLPISFFKSQLIQTTSFTAETVFESSGTTQSINSRHLIKDLSLYKKSFIKCFEIFYGSIQEYCVIGLLPSYLERKNSSLVYMVDQLIRLSRHPESGFYLREFDQLSATLEKLEHNKQKTLLIGVTFALLDFADKIIASGKNRLLQHTIIMETGGMKGRREEMVRGQVHEILKKAFGVSVIHSEYGMTELLSQAYSKKEGIFHCPPWMKVLVRDEEDPLRVSRYGTGLLNIIDLANVYSCSFIATDDVGKAHEDGRFEVLGRKDNSDLRGCSLLVA